ncbi:MAG: nucleotidyl transferase AbiEii/AbiGii toxin family protein [Deltaproteobacteria bacterium]|nr:nucleotidyl transferase AbiEii/AbiGii toxin family protein [Deltaproteobacteria bacterium]
MSKHEISLPRLHEDAALFRRALNFTAVQTGFPPILIEKDYFCTLVLAYLAQKNTGLVFKGGTCLAKILVGFYRLSEDLDFVIPVSFDASRKERRSGIAPAKNALSSLVSDIPVFEKSEGLTGANRSTQYVGVVKYQSQITAATEQISFEVSLREPLLTPAKQGPAKSIILNPVSNTPFVDEVPFSCISLQEAFAEKVRAALTRREVAIRDAYDLLYAKNKLNFDFNESAFLDLVMKKLTIPGNGPINVSPRRLEELTRQVDTRLKTVLRPEDFASFDIQAALSIVEELAAKLVTKNLDVNDGDSRGLK